MSTTGTPVALTSDQRAAAERVLDEHADDLWNLALVIAGSRQAAEDLLAAAISRALPYLDRLTAPAPIYLRKVMLNLRSADWRRRRGITETASDELPELPDVDDEPERAVLRADVASALAALPARQRAVVVLRYLEDRPVHEVAEILGCSAVTVRTQGHQALAKLRRARWLADDSRTDPERTRP